MSADRRSLAGFVVAVAVMVALGLAVFLPLFWWLPATSAWRYLTWAAAFLGPLVGGELGSRLARRLGCAPRERSLQQAAVVLIFVLGVVATLPFLTRT